MSHLNKSIAILIRLWVNKIKLALINLFVQIKFDQMNDVTEVLGLHPGLIESFSLNIDCLFANLVDLELWKIEIACNKYMFECVSVHM